MADKNAKVLVVDDNEMLAESLELTLSRNGYPYTTKFSNSMDAKEYLLHNEIDILVTDLDMPEVTGFELIDIALQKKIENIVAISANHRGNVEIMEKFPEETRIKYLLKPCYAEQLLMSISA